MASIRTVLFWLHFASGISAGAIVLIMSVTGAALTYEKQILEWADRRAWSAPPSPGNARLSPETLLARVREAQPEAAPTTLTLRVDRLAPATVMFEGQRGLLVDPSTGAILGPPPATVRVFFRTMTNWHRWLAADASSRVTGKALTGAANLAFLVLVISGIYIWIPRLWTWVQFRNVLWFRARLQGKARDFSWHNVIGVWSAVPLALIVAGAVPISYPWASNLVYRIAGEDPPPAAPVRAGTPPGAAASGLGDRPAAPRDGRPVGPGVAAPDVTGIDAAYAAAINHVPAWRSLSIRIPDSRQRPLVVTIDEGYGGQPQKRGTLTVSRAGALERWERFADLSPGRRLRSWLRFVHTGEYYGLAGQTVAGCVSGGAVVLVWTGFALATRRFLGWWARPRPESVPGRRKAA